MQFNEDDQVEYSPEGIKHKSASGFVFFEDDKTHELFLALLHKTDGRYLIPKGHIMKGEKPENAVVREIKEELSLNETPEAVSFLGADNYTFTLDKSGVTHYKNVSIYVLKLNKKADIKPKVDEGFDAAKWVPFEEAVEKISFGKENLLKARELFILWTKNK